jgi:hypothetical protein
MYKTTFIYHDMEFEEFEDDRNLNLWKVVILILQKVRDYANNDSPRNYHVELIMIQ